MKALFPKEEEPKNPPISLISKHVWKKNNPKKRGPWNLSAKNDETRLSYTARWRSSPFFSALFLSYPAALSLFRLGSFCTR